MSVGGSGGISPGDLVMIVRTCCAGSSKLIGIPFQVGGVEQNDEMYCSACRSVIPAGTAFVKSASQLEDPYNPGGTFRATPLAWVQKLEGPRAKSDRETNKPLEETPA